MIVTTREEGEAFVIALQGKVMGGPETTDFYNQLKFAVDNNRGKVVIDLGEVEWLSSTGIGLLMSASARLRNVGGEVKLANPNAKVTSVLQLNKLQFVFDIQPSVGDAARRFG